MKMIAYAQMQYGHYCQLDLGDEEQSLPDVVIVEPEPMELEGG